MGLGYIAAVIRKAGHEVSVLNCLTASIGEGTSLAQHPIGSDFVRNGLTDNEILSRIVEAKPDAVGVTCMFTSYFKDAHDTACLVKAYNPRIPVIFGGAHTSTFPEVVMRDPNVDVAVVGEAELTIVEVLQRLQEGADLRGVQGVIHRYQGTVIREPPRPFIENLDDIPFPAWDLMERDVELARLAHVDNRFLMRPPAGFLLTSRGCPMECSFCSVKLTWSRHWRARSAKNVVDEMEWLQKQYGYREFHFVDDNSSVSRSRMHAICDDILARKMDVRIATPTGIAIGTLDHEILVKMKKAGFYRFCFGIETGDPWAQQHAVRKRVDLEKAKRVIADANRLGFWTSATHIFGFPHETREHIQKTVDFAKQSNMDLAIFYLLVPQPGTKVYEEMKAEGLIDLAPYMDPASPEWYKISLTYGNGFRNRHLSNEELQQILSNAYRQFIVYKLTRPRTYLNLIRKLRSWEDVLYLFHLLHYPLGMLRRMIFGQRLSNLSIRSAHHADLAGDSERRVGQDT
jgi:magnesium-protoporphyrin IX monomethyl ester (oxidative) cyclase